MTSQDDVLKLVLTRVLLLLSLLYVYEGMAESTFRKIIQTLVNALVESTTNLTVLTESYYQIHCTSS